MHLTLKSFLMLSDAVVITDSDHFIIDVNDAYQNITGYERNKVIGRKAGILRSKLTPESTFRSLKVALKSNESWNGVFTNQKINGEYWHSSISITPFDIDRVLYYVGIFRELEQLNEGLYITESRLGNLHASLLKVLAISCEIRDPGIEAHLIRVQQFTERLLKAHCERLNMHVELKDFQNIVHSSILHDIGKSGIPEGILYKPGPLEKYERMIIEHHPHIGLDILSKIISDMKDDLLFDEFSIAKNIVLYHHERWDGKGYPHKLKGEEIPFESRIVSVVDVFDALTSKRPYKDKWSIHEAIRYIQDEKGKQFDPEIVDTFVSIEW